MLSSRPTALVLATLAALFSAAGALVSQGPAGTSRDPALPETAPATVLLITSTELNLLGDPTLDMRSEAPRTPKLETPAALALDETEWTIHTNAPGATACLWLGAEIYQFVQADDAGTATFASMGSSGEVRLTVSGPNLNTTTRTIPVSGTTPL